MILNWCSEDFLLFFFVNRHSFMGKVFIQYGNIYEKSIEFHSQSEKLRTLVGNSRFSLRHHPSLHEVSPFCLFLLLSLLVQSMFPRALAYKLCNQTSYRIGPVVYVSRRCYLLVPLKHIVMYAWEDRHFFLLSHTLLVTVVLDIGII